MTFCGFRFRVKQQVLGHSCPATVPSCKEYLVQDEPIFVLAFCIRKHDHQSRHEDRIVGPETKHVEMFDRDAFSVLQLTRHHPLLRLARRALCDEELYFEQENVV